MNARVAGFAYLFYIAVAFPSMVLLNRATRGEGIAAKLAGLAQHANDVRIAVVLSLLGCFSALVLAVTLYAITRAQDAELALLALTCRVAEGVTGAASLPATLGLLSLAMAAGPSAADPAGLRVLGAFVLNGTPVLGATFFAVGSTIFSWLLLRGRMVPVALAWLGVVGSALVVVGLFLQLAGVLSGTGAQVIWIPVALFELTLAPWLLIKGAAEPKARRRS